MTNPEAQTPKRSPLLASRQRDVALLDKILEKTKEGKILWTRMPDGWTAMLPSSLRIEVKTNADVIFGGTRWNTFTISNTRDKTEILRLGQINNPILFVAGVTSLSHQRVTELVGYLESTQDRAVQQLIDKLDQL